MERNFDYFRGLGANRSENISGIRNFRDLPRKRGENLPLPSEYDLRKYLMPVRDQGKRPTCVAQVFSCIMEYQFMRTDAQFRYNSPMFVYNLKNTPGEGMQGSDLERIGNTFGICSENKFPYLDKNYEIKPPDDAFEEASRIKIKNMIVLDTILDVKNFLVNYGPCYIAFPCYNFGPKFWESGESFNGGHSVAIVGYNSKGFILRNSWGSEWADGGYTIFPFENFGIQWEILGFLNEKPYGPLVEKKGCCRII